MTGENNTLKRKRARKREEGEEERGEKGKQFCHGSSFSGRKKQTNKKTLKKLRGK